VVPRRGLVDAVVVAVVPGFEINVSVRFAVPLSVGVFVPGQALVFDVVSVICLIARFQHVGVVVEPVFVTPLVGDVVVVETVLTRRAVRISARANAPVRHGPVRDRSFDRVDQHRPETWGLAFERPASSHVEIEQAGNHQEVFEEKQQADHVMKVTDVCET